MEWSRSRIKDRKKHIIEDVIWSGSVSQVPPHMAEALLLLLPNINMLDSCQRLQWRKEHQLYVLV